ncbi:MAG: TrkA family potassium uptake protein [Nostocaceae cyanobacterium]|nr:TrkA family potassium uptake protein [Nostocaceae cyanobacterium]
MANSQYIVVVGCGHLGSILASRLSSQGHRVVVIDHDESTFSGLSGEFSGFKISGDAAELSVLRQAQTNRANCLLAVTGEDNLNLMVAQVAKIIFQVQTVLARVREPGREAIYQDLGIATISPIELSATAFLQVLQSQLGGGK